MPGPVGEAIDAAALRRRLLELVAVYSPSGREEELCGALRNQLCAVGIAADIEPVEGSRGNLVVRPGTAEVELLLLGHLDTVTASDPDQCQPVEDGDRIHGLGTADMKGGCAALIEAFAAWYGATDGDGPVMLALVVGEEENGDGTSALLETCRPGAAIVAEPTGLRPCLAHYGYVEIRLGTVGVRRHAAEASRDRNAVFGMLRVLEALTRMFDAAHADLVFNIRDLQSSTAGFAVPDRCDAWIDLHLPPGMAPAPLVDKVEQAAREAGAGTVEFPTLAPGYRVPDAHPLPAVLRQAFAARKHAWTPDVFRSHSDANLLWQAGCPAVVLGPGLLANAHTVDEWVDFRQVEAAANLYAETLARWTA